MKHFRLFITVISAILFLNACSEEESGNSNFIRHDSAVLLNISLSGSLHLPRIPAVLFLQDSGTDIIMNLRIFIYLICRQSPLQNLYARAAVM